MALPTSMPTTTPISVDARGPRFAAWVSTAVLVGALLASAYSTAVAAVILGLQAMVFALGARFGPRRQPYGLLYATVIAPRLGPVLDREPVPPLKFAQLVGFIFAGVGVVGFADGFPAVGLAATAFALVAAFLNAAFGICLGCQCHPLVHRFRPRRRRTPHPA